MQDVFVGVVTCLTGLLFILGAAANNEVLLTLNKVRWLNGLWGRSATRLFLAVLGIGLIALGVALTRGWRLPLL